MIKLLIYLNESALRPVGGADGYNYTLRKGLEELNNDEVTIYYLKGKKTIQSINKKVESIKNKKLGSFLIILKSIVKKGLMMYGPFHRSRFNLNRFDVIHFHRTMDLYWVKNSLKKYKGKVLLTLHAPTMPSKQMFSMLSDFEKNHMKRFYRKLAYIDNYALKRADKIIVACPEAEEPYYHEWPGYHELHNLYMSKYLYMTTGTEMKIALAGKEEIRKKYNIPLNAFVISYVGRHNEIKGYDTLKKIAHIVFKTHGNVFFLIAGSEGPLFRLEDRRWVEAGWTKDPGSIIAASDLFVLPNKETYFDLILLEVLSLGQLVLASWTGGNKYFAKFVESGIFFYEKIDEAVKIIDDIIALSETEITKLKNYNKTIYYNNFTNIKFAERYIMTVKKAL